jgi:acetyl-CoA synthetase
MSWNYARYGLEGIETFGEYEILLYEEQGIEARFTNVALNNRSGAFAHGLAGLGITRGDIVAVILPNGPAVPVSFMGLFKLGVVFLPVIFALSAVEIRYTLEDSKAVAIVTKSVSGGQM